MADLGELLGMLMVSLARAREMADLETAAIAERYKDHPLLEGMSLPRVRVPELILDLPLLIEGDEAGEDPKPESPEAIGREVNQALEDSAKRHSVEIPTDVRSRFAEDLKRRLTATANLSARTGRQGALRETVVRSVESALVSHLGTPGLRASIPGDKMRSIISEVRKRADEVAESTPGKPPRITATIATSQVKEKAGAANATRIRFTLREEGLEWSISQNEDGSKTRSLQQE